MTPIDPVSFTIRVDGLLRVLVTKIGVTEAHSRKSLTSAPKVHFFYGIWDTGATNSLITQNVVDQLQLHPTGVSIVHHAQGSGPVETYSVNMMLERQGKAGEGMGFEGIPVTKGMLPDKHDVLIGMDIITCGDFAVTNRRGKTCFSFRVPSCEEIDFTRQDSNHLCACGSGRKFRKCCEGKGSKSN